MDGLMKIKVGSLFDGIGGAPLSAVLSGAEPVWASEIEKIPISITKRHFPNMKHYGDITQINGAEIEPVDIIVGGSPCQDLSVAGKRAGLAGERSGLFMEQVRIVKEMREHDRTDGRTGESIRPRYMVWENVPGAFSSNGGEDFRAVLEETARIADETVTIPRPGDDKWNTAGAIMGRNFSIAWRVLDAQYWGVPQRRRRIYLVADFGGHSAGEILFKQESLSGDITEGGEAGQRIAADAEGGTGSSGECGIICSATQQANAERYWDLYPTITASAGMAGNMGPWIAKTYGLVSKGNDEAFLMEEKHMSLSCGGGQAGQGYPAVLERRTDTERSAGTAGAHRHAVCYGMDQQGGKGGANYTENISPTILSDSHGTPQAACYGVDTYNQGAMIETAFTLRSASGGDSKPAVCYGISSYASNSMKSSNPHSGIYEADTARTIDQNGGNPACNQGGIAIVQTEQTAFTPTQFGQYAEGCGTLRASGGDYGGGSENLITNQYTVRRLTPTECERLQGFPDGWTALDHEDKAVSDTQRYKALGNSFAVPNALFVISRCVKQLQKEQVNEKD